MPPSLSFRHFAIMNRLREQLPRFLSFFGSQMMRSWMAMETSMMSISLSDSFKVRCNSIILSWKMSFSAFSPQGDASAWPNSAGRMFLTLERVSAAFHSPPSVV